MPLTAWSAAVIGIRLQSMHKVFATKAFLKPKWLRLFFSGTMCRKVFEGQQILRENNGSTTISQKKSKTTEAVANRGVDADAPRGENEDQKKRRRKKTSKCIKYVKNGMRYYPTLSRRKDVYSEKK